MIGQAAGCRCSRLIPSLSDIEHVRLLKYAAVGSQVATGGVDLEIPSGPPWIKRTPLSGAPTVDRISSVVHRGVSHDGRFVGGGARNQESEVTQGVETAI